MLLFVRQHTYEALKLYAIDKTFFILLVITAGVSLFLVVYYNAKSPFKKS